MRRAAGAPGTPSPRPGRLARTHTCRMCQQACHPSCLPPCDGVGAPGRCTRVAGTLAAAAACDCPGARGSGELHPHPPCPCTGRFTVHKVSTRDARRPPGAGAEAEAEAAEPADGRHRGRGGGWRLPWQREWDAERQLHPRTAEAVLRKWQARRRAALALGAPASAPAAPGRSHGTACAAPCMHRACPYMPLGLRRARLGVRHTAVRQQRQGTTGSSCTVGRISKCGTQSTGVEAPGALRTNRATAGPGSHSLAAASHACRHGGPGLRIGAGVHGRGRPERWRAREAGSCARRAPRPRH